jgi:hypothetical protein
LACADGEEVDHPRATALAASTAADSNLAQTTGSRNEVPARRLIGNEIDNRILLAWGEQFARSTPVARQLDYRNRAKARH